MSKRTSPAPAIAAVLANLKKSEILSIARGRCRHGRSYLQHFSCYRRECPSDTKIAEKIGYWDLETTNLSGDMGRLLTWCILDETTGKIHSDYINERDLKSGKEDSRVVASLVSAMRKFDRLVGFYSSRFDAGFARVRACANRIPFPKHGEIYHTDLYFTVRSKFKLSSRRLENACVHILGHSRKTKLDMDVWVQAGRGDAKAIQTVLHHNVMDVKDTQALYHATKDYVKQNKTSL